ncbi:hypothetical protein BpHYR1_022834 [Brachionus plicatilis]|uniref:Uncharacterized protein n=1 Tax=Brachionus plicatilis TaxID=10195 RepID=A0A3M7QHV1_BRAPC|nr:hypothetical protein BpHYR1_022834 [Brachionus plicatilis]
MPKQQHKISELRVSLRILMHFPLVTCQTRDVPSSDAVTIKSLVVLHCISIISALWPSNL